MEYDEPAAPENNVKDEDIIWRGRQWCVSTFGLETIKEPYHYDIAKARLGEMREPQGVEFLEHMADKTWLDFDDFKEAFLKALDIHKGSYTPIDPDQLRLSLENFERDKVEMAKHNEEATGRVLDARELSERMFKRRD